MRILMLTDDVQIDRRILLEAESLHKLGHEVILIAEPGHDMPAFEHIGNVKVERALVPDHTRGELIFLRLSVLVGMGISKLSAIIQRLIGLVAVAVSRLFGLMVKLVSGAGSLTLRLHQRLTARLISVSRLLRPMTLPESNLVDRMVFYRPDVIHAHDLPRLRAAVVAKQKLGVPVVYDAHELYPEIGTLTPKEQKRLKRQERRYIKQADATITVNGFIADEMAKRYEIEPPHVILNATNWPAHLDRNRHWDRFRPHFGIPSEDRILLFQGWMSFTRGLQPLVHAMEHVADDIHLVFMGYGEARPELEEISRMIGVAGRVHFMDAVSQDVLLSWTASADAGIIPYQPVDINNYYSSPNKLFEFIQAGLPIIANDLPFLREIVEGEGFGIIEKLDNVTDYSTAISRIFSDEGHLLKGFRANLLGSRGRYSWTREEEKLIAIYDSLL